jgi:predicted NBD/HSP70 family sugar kinase
VLRLVHSSGGVSRAQLARATGLNRSTIAALVAELVQLGLVIEESFDKTRQLGRPSLLIEPGRAALALVVNPDLDAVRVGLVSLGGHLVTSVRFATVRPPSAQEVVTIVTAVFAGMRSGLDPATRYVGVGLAVPGLVDGADGTVIDAPHLGWRDEPVSRLLSEALDLPVWAANDAVVGTRAQTLFGEGRGVRDLVYLYGGASGIGGGVVTGGKLVDGANGFAGQLGHTHVKSDGVQCDCGVVGCLEAEVTRRELIDAVGLADDDVESLEEAVLRRLEEPGSEALAAVVDRQVQLLAVALRSVVSLLNPSMILLGGFLRILLLARPTALTEAVHASAIRGPREDVAIALASRSDGPLLIGAAELAFEAILNDPASAELAPQAP